MKEATSIDAFEEAGLLQNVLVQVRELQTDDPAKNLEINEKFLRDAAGVRRCQNLVTVL